MIFKKDLMAFKKEITVVGKKVENLLKAFEKDVKAKVVNGLLELSHFRSSDLSHMPFYSEAHSLPPL